MNQLISVLNEVIKQKKKLRIDEDLFIEYSVPHEIPEKMPKIIQPRRSMFDLPNFSVGDFLKEYKMREAYIEIGMFGFISWNWISPFSKWVGTRKCLEVMSGRGWFSKALRDKEINVTCTDDFSWAEDKYLSWQDSVTEVEKLDAVDAVEKYGTKIEILLMSWADTSNTAYKVIKRLHEVNPKALVVFIGEGMGGCTANNNFFNHFDEIDDETFIQASSKYEQWYGIKDRLFLGKYRP